MGTINYCIASNLEPITASTTEASTASTTEASTASTTEASTASTTEASTASTIEEVKTVSTIMNTTLKKYHWDQIPIEIWEHILSFLDPDSINIFIKCSKSTFMYNILTNIKIMEFNRCKNDIFKIPFDCHNQILRMKFENGNGSQKEEKCKIYVQWKYLSIFDSMKIEQIQYKNENENKAEVKLIHAEVTGKWLVLNVSSNILSGYRLVHLETNEGRVIESESNDNVKLKKFGLVVVGKKMKLCTNDECWCLGHMDHDYIGQMDDSPNSFSMDTLINLHRPNPDIDSDSPDDFNVLLNPERFIKWQYEKSSLFHYGKPDFIPGYREHFRIEHEYNIVDISVMGRNFYLLTVFVLLDKKTNSKFKAIFYESDSFGPDVRARNYQLIPHVTHYWSFNGSLMFGVTLKNQLIILAIHDKFTHSMGSIVITSLLLRMNLLIIGTKYGEIRIYRLNNINELFNNFDWLKPNYSCFLHENKDQEIIQIVPVEWSTHFDIIVTSADASIYRLKVNFQEIIWNRYNHNDSLRRT